MIGHPNYQKKLAGVTEKNSWDDCIKEICQCGLKSLIKKLHSMLSMSLKKASCLIKAEKLNCLFSMDNLCKASVMYYTWESQKAQVIENVTIRHPKSSKGNSRHHIQKWENKFLSYCLAVWVEIFDEETAFKIIYKSEKSFQLNQSNWICKVVISCRHCEEKRGKCGTTPVYDCWGECIFLILA